MAVAILLHSESAVDRLGFRVPQVRRQALGRDGFLLRKHIASVFHLLDNLGKAIVITAEFGNLTQNGVLAVLERGYSGHELGGEGTHVWLGGIGWVRLEVRSSRIEGGGICIEHAVGLLACEVEC